MWLVNGRAGTLIRVVYVSSAALSGKPAFQIARDGTGRHSSGWVSRLTKTRRQGKFGYLSLHDIVPYLQIVLVQAKVDSAMIINPKVLVA